LVACGRLSWLLVSFWAHVNIVHHIISYHIISYHIISYQSLHYTRGTKSGPLATTLFAGKFTKCCRFIFNIHHVRLYGKCPKSNHCLLKL